MKFGPTGFYVQMTHLQKLASAKSAKKIPCLPCFKLRRIYVSTAYLRLLSYFSFLPLPLSSFVLCEQRDIGRCPRHRQRHFIYRIVQSICAAYKASCAVGPADIFQGIECRIGDNWVPVTTAWSVLRALMEKGLPDSI
jgi:hypothetical protein